MSVVYNPPCTANNDSCRQQRIVALESKVAELEARIVALESPPPSGGPVPTVPAGTVVPTSLVFDDEFDGTTVDMSKWTISDGWNLNNLTTRAYNTSVSGGLLRLQLSNPDGTVTGAAVETLYDVGRYQFAVGDFLEARVLFPGDGTSVQDIYNWPAAWTSGPNWPAAGEHDYAEGLGGDLTVNYHSPTINQQYPVTPTCCWGNSFHIFGIYRGANFADVYWDGVRQAHYTTADNGLAEDVILNVGRSNTRTPILGDAGVVKVDYIRAWR